jgi:propanol-preferring alcohol dehydrogenase
MDMLVFQELRILGSLGCPMSSYAGMLSMVAAGKLRPGRLVETTVSVENAGNVLAGMTGYETFGFSLIDNWRRSSQTVSRERDTLLIPS